MKVSPKNDNIPNLQQSIQILVHSIEREKIKRRINQERYTKKVSEYNKLLGKPVSPTKEQKVTIRKQKLEKIKNRDIFSPNYGKRINFVGPDDEIKTLKRCLSLNEIKLNEIKNDVNKQALVNSRILNEINLIRKDKLIQKGKMEKIFEENKDISLQIKMLSKTNRRSLSKINFDDLKKHQDENKFFEEKFKQNRESLEQKYHQVLEENIRREKEKKNELSKLRLANARIADNVRRNSVKSSDQFINADRDEIQDRIPILDALLDKWNHTIKYKTQMVNKYIANSAKIKEALDKLLLLTGLERYEQLPIVYDMEEAQNAKIDEILSEVNNDVDILKEQKEILEKNISKLQKSKKEIINQNEINIKEKEMNIEILKKLNDDLTNQINRKKTIFSEMEECTLNFLKKMENTYLSDFVVKKINLGENSKINENNVLDYLGAVYCYLQLINDFHENVQLKNEIKQNINISQLASKSIEVLDKEIKFKLSKFNYKNCFNKVKKDAKQKNPFDDVIRRLANEIVKDVNNYDTNEPNSKYGTNNSSSAQNSKKKNVRYKEHH